MASLIKSQLVKTLARYTKNLTSDNINVSLFKGEGEFLDLQLDEDVLHSVLQMPSWLRIDKVTCNKVTWKIPWTKLKTEAITIRFDAICVEISAIGPNEKPNASVDVSNPSSTSGSKTSPTKYGFIDKVIDSICLAINTVDIKFSSAGFQASLHASRIQLRSTNPLWQVADLRSTRIVHEKTDQVIIFKEILLNAIKLEASVITSSEEKPTPLRLITSHSSLKITVKKRISDSVVLCGRLELVLDDILWVLNEKQLKASVSFVKSIVDLMRESHEHHRGPAKDDEVATSTAKLNRGMQPTIESELNNPYVQYPSTMGSKPIDRLFCRYNILETSFHVVTGRIDFHFCGGLSRKDNSAMQVLFDKLSMDYYPEHLAGMSRQHWLKNNDTNLTRCTWGHQLLTTFYDNNPKLSVYKKWLREGALLVRLEDITISQLRKVTDTNEGDGKSAIKPLLSSERTVKIKPALSLDHTFYFYNYPDIEEKITSKLGVPNSNVFISTNSIQCTIVDTTIAWANAFINNVFSSWSGTNLSENKSEDEDEVMDVKVDMKKTTLTLDLPMVEKIKLAELRNIPSALSIQVSQMDATNSIFHRLADDTYKLSKFYVGKKFFKSASFPNKEDDLRLIPDVFNYANNNTKAGVEWLYDPKYPSWKIDCKTVSIDFILDNELSTFIPATPISLWMYSYKTLNKENSIKSMKNSGDNLGLTNNPDMSILIDIKNKLNIVLNHMEYLFIIRLQASLMQLNRDLGSNTTTSSQTNGTKLSLAILVNDLELGLLLPMSPYSESCETYISDDQTVDDDDNESNNLSATEQSENLDEDFNLLDDFTEDIDIDDDSDQSKDDSTSTEKMSKSVSSHSGKIFGKPKTSQLTDSLSTSTVSKTSIKKDKHEHRSKKQSSVPVETNTSISGLLANVLGNIGLVTSAVGVTTVASAIAELDIKPITALIDVRKNEMNDSLSEDSDEDMMYNAQLEDDVISLKEDKIDSSEGYISAEQREKLQIVNDFYGSGDEADKEVCIVMIKLQQIGLGVQVLGPELILKVTSKYGTVREMGNTVLSHFVGRKSRVIAPPLKHSQQLHDTQVRGRITLNNGNIFAHMKLNGIQGNLMATNLTNMNRFFLDDTNDTVKPGMAFVFEIFHSLISIINDNSELIKIGLNIMPVEMLIRDSTMYRLSDIFMEEIKEIVANKGLQDLQRTAQVHVTANDTEDQFDYIGEIRNLIYTDAKKSESNDGIPLPVPAKVNDPYIDAYLSESSESAVVKTAFDQVKEDNKHLYHLLKITQSALKAKRDEQVSLVKTIHHLEDELLSSYCEQNKLLRIAASVGK